MARISLILNIILLIAVSALYYMQFNEDPAKGAEKTGPAVENKEQKKHSAAAESNIRYINTDTLWENYEFIRKAKAELEATTQQMQSSFDTKVQAFQKDIQKFQEDARYMTREQGERRQQELAQKEQELGQLQEDLAARMAEKRDELNKEIREKVTKFLDEYNDEKDHNLILSYSQGGAILEADSSLDITTEVVNAMNEEYYSSTPDSMQTLETTKGKGEPQ